MLEEKELTVISATDFYKLITLELVYEAIEFVQRKNIELKKSTKYSILLGEKTYPPKEIMRFMAKLKGYEIIEKSLFGGHVNKPFEKLGLVIISNSENNKMIIKDIEPYVKSYNQNIRETNWLKELEIYKFNFIEWIQKNIDFNVLSNSEIQNKIELSQKQNYTPGSTTKGVNFIQTIIRYQNDYITIEDVDKIKKIINKQIPVTKDNVTLSFKSFPKTSAYLSFFDPDNFIAYDGESSPASEFLTDQSKIPKKDFAAFSFFQNFYKDIKSLIKKSSIDTELIEEILKTSFLSELHWNFITQDFLLFVTRKIMDSKTLQANYDKFIKTDNTEQSEWYKNIKDFTEYMSVIRKNTIENKYTCYQELNDDFKEISNNIGEDFLQRYLFESNNGFSTIRNQLIQLEKRILIRQKVENKFSLLKDIISNNDIHETYDKIESLIDGKNKTVIYRFLRAIFPNDFTSIDSPFHLNTLIKKLSNDFLINIESSHQIEKNNEILALIKYDDIFKAQIFFWKYKIQNELNNDLITSDDFENTLMNKKYPLNQILYGAPGTGKTYNTKRIAVEIITGKSITNRSEINKEFEILKEKGHIKFTTFHQSLSYEDFIEGIKPDINDKGDIIYSVKDGIFKSLCNTAKTINLNTTESEFDFNTCSYYKMSLGGLQNLDKHYWCLENDLIFLGWGGDRDFTKISRTKDWITFRDKFKEEFPDLVDDSRFVIQAVYQFQNMNIGDIVLVSKGNKVIDAVGIIQSEYFYDDKQGIDHYQFRKVKWLGKNLNLDPSIFVRKSISQQTIYQFYNVDIKNEVFQEMFNTPKEKKYNNYVLIIDEINRGNVSAIFGELITLIEDDKRDGKENPEKIELTLPYSQNEFSVPDNLYIIGTMNTADRSVEALDSALRRRFSFTEMKSNPTVLEEEHENRGIIENNEINLASLLLSINSRIELLIDKDHQIGHSYFIKVRTLEELKYTFKNKILPLLEEYFYGDFGKIGLVLGDNFVSTKTSTEDRNILSNFKGYEDLQFIEDKKMYIFKDIDHMIISDFTSIYND